MATLYELSDAYLKLQDTDELTEEELAVAIQNIGEIFTQKAINIGKLVLSMQADGEAIEGEIKRLTLRKLVIDNRVKGLKFYLAQEMGLVQMDKIKSDVLTISLQKSPPSVNIIDEAIIPDSYWRIIPETKEIDKKAILSAFKETGEITSGVEIISDRKHIVIR